MLLPYTSITEHQKFHFREKLMISKINLFYLIFPYFKGTFFPSVVKFFPPWLIGHKDFREWIDMSGSSSSNWYRSFSGKVRSDKNIKHG